MTVGGYCDSHATSMHIYLDDVCVGQCADGSVGRSIGRRNKNVLCHHWMHRQLMSKARRITENFINGGEEILYLYLTVDDIKNAKLVCFSFIKRNKLTRFSINKGYEITLSDLKNLFENRPMFKNISLMDGPLINLTFVQYVLKLYSGKKLNLNLGLCFELKKIPSLKVFFSTFTKDFDLVLSNKEQNDVTINLCGNFNIFRYRMHIYPLLSPVSVVTLFLCSYWYSRSMENHFISLLDDHDMMHVPCMCNRSAEEAHSSFVHPLHETDNIHKKTEKDKSSTVVTNGVNAGVDPLFFVLHKEESVRGLVWKIKKIGNLNYILSEV